MVDGHELVTAELLVHLEQTDGEDVWWAESPNVPGFSAAASSYAELRRMSFAALELALGPGKVSVRLDDEA